MDLKQDIKPFYMKGNGCFAKAFLSQRCLQTSGARIHVACEAEKIPGMKLKMDSSVLICSDSVYHRFDRGKSLSQGCLTAGRKMKKVRDVRTCGVFSRPRSMPWTWRRVVNSQV